MSKAMPEKALHFRIVPEHRCILMRLVGDHTADDIVAAMYRIMAHPDYDLGYHTLCDNRELTTSFTALLSRQLIEIASVMRKRIGTRAAVLAKNVLQAKMINAINAFSSDDVQVNGFVSLNAAFDWLDISADGRIVIEPFFTGLTLCPLPGPCGPGPEMI